MALVGTHAAAWTAIKAAKAAARDAYLGSHAPPLSEAQVFEMIDDMEKAALQAMFAHFVANAVVASTVLVTSVAGVTTGMGVSGPGTGTATGTIA